eukprot:TRINITY_DN2838_c0_g1_i1.p2 TRINITY_DN2838_c0_g1~~TRINITY_DN2838_c0_g1_i1.p2  ORF type:complete len:205 (-),score=15.09 TRINITY_DN2838_c0_g1_i1:1960-2574(-)
MDKPAYPKSLSHIGITVPDLEKAYKFYTEVMGWYTIMPPTTIKEDTATAVGQMCIDVFGSGFSEFKICHLSTADRIGVEMFEFPKADKAPATFNPFKTGVFHFCVQDPDVEGLAEKIKAAGGKQRMPVRYYYPGEKPYRMVYMEDPFGNIIEIYSHSYELTYSAGAYQHEAKKQFHTGSPFDAHQSCVFGIMHRGDNCNNNCVW